MFIIDRPDALAATVVENGIVAVSLELSRSKWLVTSLLSGSEKMSKHMVAAGNATALLALLGQRRRQAEERAGGPVRVVAITEAGLDGFWLHRLLEANGIESHVVDAASVAVPRRRRRGKSDGIDGETLLRTLLAWRRGEPRVCSMVRPPSPQEEDRRRVVRERAVLIRERIALTNRIGGLLMSQGVTDYQPLRRDRRERLDTLVTGDGRALPPQMKRELSRALDRLDLLLQQIKAVEAERDAMQEAAMQEATREAATSEAAATEDAARLLLRLRAIGPQTAAVLTLEAFYRHFDNRRQVAAFAGLAPSPWQSGAVAHDQGISKAGQPQLRKTMVELAWLWRRHQPGSALSRWFAERARGQDARRRRMLIVALARKLLVALWRYVTTGVVPEGAAFKAA
jgi:transposase